GRLGALLQARDLLLAVADLLLGRAHGRRSARRALAARRRLAALALQLGQLGDRGVVVGLLLRQRVLRRLVLRLLLRRLLGLGERAGEALLLALRGSDRLRLARLALVAGGRRARLL